MATYRQFLGAHHENNVFKRVQLITIKIIAPKISFIIFKNNKTELPREISGKI